MSKTLQFKTKGIALFPKKNRDNGEQFQVALTISNEDYQNFANVCKETYPNYSVPKLSGVTLENGEEVSVINMKSSFDFPIYNINGTKLEKDENDMPMLYHNAKAIVGYVVKEYEFKRQKGITIYITGAIIIEQGEKAGVSFDRLIKGFENELPF